MSAGDEPYEKLAISFAFAQSAKLAVFEAALEATTEEIKPIPEQLAARGRCKFTVNEVARLTGRVFLPSFIGAAPRHPIISDFVSRTLDWYEGSQQPQPHPQTQTQPQP